MDKRTAVLRQKSKLVTQICTIILQESSSPCFVFCTVSSQTIFIADYYDVQKARTVNMVCYILVYFLNSWIFINSFLREFARKNFFDIMQCFSANTISILKRKIPSTDVPCYYSKIMCIGLKWYNRAYIFILLDYLFACSTLSRLATLDFKKCWQYWMDFT